MTTNLLNQKRKYRTMKNLTNPNIVLIFLSIAIVFTACKKENIDITDTVTPEPETIYDMEGKWVYEGLSLNTMYIYEAGVRYTYYCTEGNCDSLYQTFEAGDANALPGTHNYTFVDDTLTVDLNFGNELVTPITFECEGGQAIFITPEYSVYRLESDCW